MLGMTIGASLRLTLPSPAKPPSVEPA
jgi:hypothetical protein